MDKKDLYKILGINKKASQDEIKTAYRNKAKQHHPDKGGSSEQMNLINKANDILSDPTKRKFYDETGQDETPDFEKKFTIYVSEFIQKLVVDESIDCERLDFINHLNIDIAREIDKYKGYNKDWQKVINKYIALKRKLKKQNTISIILENEIVNAKQSIAFNANQISFLNKAYDRVGESKANF